MKKEGKVQNDKRKKEIILITAIALIVSIIGSIVLRNVVIKQQARGENYMAGENASSGLIANNIKKGITIGGITGTLETLDTSDANATPADILEGKTAYVNGVKITGAMKDEIKLVDITGNETQNMQTQDNLGNRIIIPAGFKVVNPTDNVEKGIVIEDVSAGNNDTKGSQFVWIPVGPIQTSKGIKIVSFGRYIFDTSGKEILVQSAENYANETQLKTSNTSSAYYRELLKTTTSSNTKAKDIEAFAIKTIINGGYYIGRYKGGDANATNEERTDSSRDDNPVVCRTGVYPYNYVTQSQASSLCQDMYNNSNFTSDLINSYAWDTAIVFIQKCSEDTNYSQQVGKNTRSAIQKVGESILANVDTGDEAKDVRCNIYDMAGNTWEWTTETYPETAPCVYRGGGCNSISNQTSYRNGFGTTASYFNFAIRPILYLE